MSSKSSAEQHFEKDWVDLFPSIDLHSEHRFHPPRKWRFDYAHLPTKTAIEIEGGVWTKGRHTRGGGFLKDCQKYLQAAVDGWVVVRITPCMIGRDNLIAIAAVLRQRGWTVDIPLENLAPQVDKAGDHQNGVAKRKRQYKGKKKVGNHCSFPSGQSRSAFSGCGGS